MKKEYVIGIVAVTIIIILAVLTAIFYNYKNFTSDLKQKEEAKLAERQLQDSNEEYTLQMTSTSTLEEKTSPTAIMIFKTKYEKCNHVTIDRKEIPEKLVNKTEKEIKEVYKDWNLEEFSPNQITFYQEKSGMCEEHYVLRDNNGYLTIYTVDAEGNEKLKEITQVITSYLPETDLMKLKEGIRVNGQEELNSAIEDYE